MFLQQARGIVRLALPLIILFHFQPTLFQSFTGQALCAILIGTYLWYLSWVQLKNLTTNLQHTPTGDNHDLYSDCIKECNVNPNDIILKYAYAGEAIAMAASNTIIIDPIVWHGCDNDPEAIKVKNVFLSLVEPTLCDMQKKRILEIHKALTPGAQRFILKHELGHVVDNFSYKKLIIIFSIATTMAYIGIASAIALLPIGGLVATLLGMMIGGSSDLTLTFLSNFFWKFHEEKRADEFAAQHSSDEDIREAARFFEVHQDILDTNKESNILANLPSTLRTGHPNGYDRSAYLLQLLTNKAQ